MLRNEASRSQFLKQLLKIRRDLRLFRVFVTGARFVGLRLGLCAQLANVLMRY